MRIINKTNNTVLAEDVIFAQTIFKRIKGLLCKKEFNKGQALVIKPCNSIHTFFMRFPIDCLFVDKNYRVIKAISNIRPFRITRIYWLSNLAVELPAGTLELTHTQENDTIEIVLPNAPSPVSF